jgi:hypothetical protein
MEVGLRVQSTSLLAADNLSAGLDAACAGSCGAVLDASGVATGCVSRSAHGLDGAALMVAAALIAVLGVCAADSLRVCGNE